VVGVRPADALAAGQEAVAIRRDLAAAMPDRYRPDLAHSLSKLSFLLSALDRSADADTALNEARAIRSSDAGGGPK
jgi:hypothetical protein